ncbi:MAG: LPS export ABC transporter permease LptG [Hyphomicrobiaceae bacterium]
MIAATLLRRYLAWRFLTTIAGTFLLCSILIFMIDFVELLRQAGKYGSVPVRTLVWMALLRLPAYTEILLAFAVLVGTMAALLLLNRKSELAIMRTAGMSVWQFLRPGLTLAFTMGVTAVVAYNPLAAAARAEAERLSAEVFGRESTLLRPQGGTNWLRQDGIDGPSVIGASSASRGGLALTAVTVFQFDREGRFVERIDGRRARLYDGYWQIMDAAVTRMGRPPETFGTYIVSSYLTPERVQDALGSAIAQSVWELPGLIDLAEKAGLSPARYRIQFDLLLSRPLLLMTMVLLGATVSLRSFRSGRIQTMVIAGMVGGFGFFLLAEVSRQIGVAELVPSWVAVWVPVIVATLVSTTVLLHQEDG